jgi:hypothetical protein
MAKKLSKGHYQCKYCGKIFYNELLATSCEQGHDLIYVPLTREDIQRLMQFMVTGESELLTESLVKTLQKYSRNLKT